MDDNIVRKIDNETSYMILTANCEIEVGCYIRYTFAHGVTDDIRLTLPIGTKLYAEIHKGDKFVVCNVLKDKKRIHSVIETALDRKYADMKDDYPTLCESFLIHVDIERLNNFQLQNATESDLLDVWFD